MSICTGCGGEGWCYCSQAGAPSPYSQQIKQYNEANRITYGQSSTPTYITDILERLTRIENLLREGKT